MKVICTEKSQILGTRLAASLGVDIADTRFARFPDGELYLRAGSLDDAMVCVGSVVDSDSLVELLLLLDACAGADTTLVIPYMGYARQDKQFNPGEPVSARAVARALSRGADRVITVNIHEDTVLAHFDAPAASVSLAPDIGALIGTMGCADPLILAPDGGASAFAHAIANVGGWDCDELKKTRLSGDQVRIEPKSIDVAGREAIIVDDIISTGGTLATATGMLYEQGAAAVHAACVHGVLASGAYARLCHAGVRSITASDTIESACSRYSAADRIAAALRPIP
ncbi:MAG: ribose-phosphate diphosphokinase [Methanomicrobiales archaeon]|nr:ribose-phosphate diphosphokinase [Methanomicrobiales archaeon]